MCRSVGGMVNLTFSVASEIAVVGHNPEFADLDHPNGEIEGEIFFIVAEDRAGNRWRSDEMSEVEAGIRAAALNALPRVTLSGWAEWYPVYGSAAYSEADVVAWELRQNADELSREAEYRAILNARVA
jgi:hypothetical protein